MSNINITPFYSKGYENAEVINIQNKDGVAVVSSRVVAYDFDKQHKHVLEAIENLIKDMGVAEKSADLFIESKYQHPQNKQWYKEYLLTRDGFSLLVMGFTGKEALQWKLQYIEAFNKMEEQIKQASHNPYANLSPELQSIIMLDQKQQMLEQQVQTVQQKVNEIEENAKLDPAEYSLVSKRVSSRVYEVQKERQMNLNKKQIGELFRALNRDILEITGVKTRTQLRQKHLDMVLDFINDWYPSRAAMFNINQMSLEI
ncbi:Rha family transcriptional regulator [Turicibacter sanguinis]|uniref:Rha family transcriptional regulator n=1 Tax=Turicibacter sanguinis TaxID=154288 RepID=UPI0021D4A8E7|nr:Rha family transcriptional regulator [Turicibacter sanguinis]MCU7201459.1 Rha family transcriptional regulator [Turicibacter sanguinis]